MRVIRLFLYYLIASNFLGLNTFHNTNSLHNHSNAIGWVSHSLDLGYIITIERLKTLQGLFLYLKLLLVNNN